MIHRKPEGYKDLLVYQKAAELQAKTFELTHQFPQTKTLIALADQMDRSARSGTKNIIEGWKRNTTKQYFDFLGFSIGSIEELKDDLADIAKGLYPDLMEIKGLMGGRGLRGKMGGTGAPLDPLKPFPPPGSSPPLSPLNPFMPPDPFLHPGPFKSSPPFNPLKPFTPFSESDLTRLRFYPLDISLPPAVQLYLRAKEVLMLLNKLQKSLDVKMDEEMTKPSGERARGRIQDFGKETKKVEEIIKGSGLVRLIDGRVITKEEYEKRMARGENLKLFGE